MCRHSKITNVVIPQRGPMRFIMLQCAGMGTPLSGDYVVRGFPSIFTPNMNKSYESVVRYWCRMITKNVNLIL